MFSSKIIKAVSTESLMLPNLNFEVLSKKVDSSKFTSINSKERIKQQLINVALSLFDLMKSTSNLQANEFLNLST